MTKRLRHLLAPLICGGLALAACSEGGTAGAAPSAAAQKARIASTASGFRATSELAHAMECWGLAHGAYFLHMASPELAAELPRATPQDYLAWGNQGATLVKAQGGTLADFDALKEQFGTRLLNQEERRDAAPKLAACLATTPHHMLDVEQPILTSDS